MEKPRGSYRRAVALSLSLVWAASLAPAAEPGVYILGPAPQAYVGTGSLPYLFASGTSEAAPHVAGLAALIKSPKPDLSPADIMKVIRYTADDVNRSTLSGRDARVGYGRINMERALAPYVLK